MKSKHVAVLMGGFSSERPVSLSSGSSCADALEAQGFRVTRIDVDRNVGSVLAELRPDVAFNALHGPFGEDGTIQGILEYLAIPYTHSGVLASALAMNKEQAKKVAKAAGIPVAESKIVNRFEVRDKHPMPAPYVVKPVAEGSSFGVVIVKEDRTHPPQVIASEEWHYGDMVMVERYVHGRELTCAVMGDVALGVCEIVPTGHAFYDYDSKYAAGGSRHVVPARMPEQDYARALDIALRAHQALGCRGASRADLRYDETAEGARRLVLLEVNTQPGLTRTSLLPEQAAHCGIPFPALCAWMVREARHGA